MGFPIVSRFEIEKLQPFTQQAFHGYGNSHIQHHYPHNPMNGFTRQETLALTGITAGMMSYLDETGEVVPMRIGNTKRPNVVYSVDQVIDLKIASVLRPRMLWKDTVRVIRFVRGAGYCKSVFQVPLATVNGEMMRTSSWTEAGLHDDSFGRKVLEVAKTNKGRVTVQDMGMIGNVLGAIREAAISADILDFEKRVKGTLLEVS
jgi:hypothetical protein